MISRAEECLEDDKVCNPWPGLARAAVCDIQYSSVRANQQQEAIYSCNSAANTPANLIK